VTRMHGPWTGAAVALAAAAAVSGCGGSAAATPAPVPTPTLSSTAQLRLPIASYELSGTQNAEAEYLDQLYVQECMHGFGFEYLAGLSMSSIAENSRVTAELNSRRYGVSDQVAAATYGYHIPSWAKSAAAPAPFPQQGVPEFRVLTGRPEHDITCKRQVNLIGVEFAVESDYENAGIARNTQALANDRVDIAADAAGLRRLMSDVKDQAGGQGGRTG
jgi:hypothetical protein